LVGAWVKNKQQKYLFDKNEMSKVQKQIDKTQSTKDIEKSIMNMNTLLKMTEK
jgi:hypothetical protein